MGLRPALLLDPGCVDPGHHVGVGDDQPLRGHEPAALLDRAAGLADDACRVLPRAPSAARWRLALRRALDRPGRGRGQPLEDLGEPEAVQELPDLRQQRGRVGHDAVERPRTMAEPWICAAGRRDGAAHEVQGDEPCRQQDGDHGDHRAGRGVELETGGWPAPTAQTLRPMRKPDRVAEAGDGQEGAEGEGRLQGRIVGQPGHASGPGAPRGAGRGTGPRTSPSCSAAPRRNPPAMASPIRARMRRSTRLSPSTAAMGGRYGVTLGLQGWVRAARVHWDPWSPSRTSPIPTSGRRTSCRT